MAPTADVTQVACRKHLAARQQSLVDAITSRQIQIVAPTMNAQACVDNILGHGNRIGLPVRVLVGTKS